MKWPRDQASSLRDSNVWGQRAGERNEASTQERTEDQSSGAFCTNGAPAEGESRTTPLLAIASGKGGVGKTFLAVNLALALRRDGHRPLLVDLDWGLANVDVALGIAPRRHIGHALLGECSLEDAMIEHEGITVLPNGCGHSGLAGLQSDWRTGLLQEICAVRPDRDFLVVDTHPGIGPLTLDVLGQVKTIIVVSTPEPTALTDTYALFKVLGEARIQGHAVLVINQAGSAAQADEAARHLDSVSRRFLGRGIPYGGCVVQDGAVPQSVHQQRALLNSAPRSQAARLVRQLAAAVAASMTSDRSVRGTESPSWGNSEERAQGARIRGKVL